MKFILTFFVMIETKFLSTTFKMSDAFKIFIQYLISCMLDPNFAAEVERKQGTPPQKLEEFRY